MAIASIPLLKRLAFVSLTVFSLILAAPQAHAQDKVLKVGTLEAHPRHLRLLL